MKRALRYLLYSSGTLIGMLVVAAVALYLNTMGEHQVPATVATDPTLPQVTIDGVTFHAESFGDPARQTVIVVHGGPGGNYGDLLNLHQLADEYFVVFYDQRGAGLSPRVDAAELSLESSVADLHRFVTHYGQGGMVHLVGHSWGAMLTAAYLGEHPTHVEKAVLAEPGAVTNAGLARFQERQAAAQGLAYYRVLLPTLFASLHLVDPDADAQQDYIFGRMSAAFVDSAASGYRCADATVQPVQPTLPLPEPRFGATAYTKLFGPQADLSSIVANAGNFTRELLFMAAACSEFIGVAWQEQQMHYFPNATLAVIPAAGHNMFAENPAATLAEIRQYFGRPSKVSSVRKR